VQEYPAFGISDEHLCQSVGGIVSVILAWSSDKKHSTDGTDCRLAYNLARRCNYCQDDHGGYVGMFFTKIFDDGEEYEGTVVGYDPSHGYECVYEDGDFEHLSQAGVEKLGFCPPFKWTCTKCTLVNKCVAQYLSSSSLHCHVLSCDACSARRPRVTKEENSPFVKKHRVWRKEPTKKLKCTRAKRKTKLKLVTAKTKKNKTSSLLSPVGSRRRKNKKDIVRNNEAVVTSFQVKKSNSPLLLVVDIPNIVRDDDGKINSRNIPCLDYSDAESFSSSVSSMHFFI
jgi:hypothetical protein